MLNISDGVISNEKSDNSGSLHGENYAFSCSLNLSSSTGKTFIVTAKYYISTQKKIKKDIDIIEINESYSVNIGYEYKLEGYQSINDENMKIEVFDNNLDGNFSDNDSFYFEFTGNTYKIGEQFIIKSDVYSRIVHNIPAKYTYIAQLYQRTDNEEYQLEIKKL